MEQQKKSNFMSNIWNTLKSKFNNTSPQNIEAQDEIKQSLDAGKTVTFKNPKSERYTYLPNMTSKTGYKKYSPSTPEEKETLSPIGFFRQGEINDEKQKKIAERIKAAASMMGAKELTPDQKELVTKQAEREQMYTQDIPSTAIKNVKYNPKTEELYVTFQGSSKKYWYPRVPKEKIEAMMEAPSKGEYFIENIHNVYSVNPSHKHEDNVKKNQNIKNYYKKMKKYYKNVRTTGKM